MSSSDNVFILVHLYILQREGGLIYFSMTSISKKTQYTTTGAPLNYFRKGQNLVYYKMVSCQTIFVYKEAAGKGIHYHYIFLSYV